MNKDEIKVLIREELEALLGRDKYLFDKHIQIKDGQNIITGRTTGTQIGSATDQKIGFFGATPTSQIAAIADPDSMSGTYVQSEQTKQNDAIMNILDALQSLGLIAT
uniref:Uncharacterized protein n=1 Tax=viral metagenome TaxID=1070528 RepID=A0A6H1ZH78_9ZZZZ